MTTTITQLNPELSQYLTTKRGYLEFAHPIYNNPYVEEMNGFFNEGFELKKKMVTDAVSERDWFSFISHHSNDYKLYGFKKVQHLMTDAEYWKNLNEVWKFAGRISEEIEDWREMFSSPRPGREHFMCDDDRSFFNNLPDAFTVYRGIRPGKKGFSYSLDKNVALEFAIRGGSATNLIERTLSKKDCIAYISHREEQEIICLM